MPERHDDPTADDERNETLDTTMNRRRLLQVGGAGLAVGALATVNASALDSDLPNTIIFDGTDSPEMSTYEFFTSGEVAVHPERGANDNPDAIKRGNVVGEIADEIHAYQFSGTLSYLDVEGVAEVTLLYDDEGKPQTDRLEIVASSDGEVDYQIRSSDTVEKVIDNGDRSASEEDDSVTETDDGTWVVDGSTENGYGDTYDFHGDIERFEPVTGEFTLFFNGEETTVTELTGQESPEEEPEEAEEREHWYSFEATGDDYVDYYLEVEEGGDIIPSEVDDAVVEPDYHWINDDQTKAAGRVQAGDTHAYEFDTLVADVTIDGDAHATVDDVDSNLDYYPRDPASGDHWKGYFPWHLEGEERTHWYSFEATGDDYVDYYFEVEEGGELIPSEVDDAVIDYEYFWIGDDGTKAAGRVFPGETHAYAFDTLVADVTIEGDAHATVNGSDSNLDYYPREPASGDDWKGGFPWQDDDHQVESDTDVGIRHDLYDGPIGGGDGISSRLVHDGSNADVVVTDGNVDSALNSASAGDLIYIDGSASGFTVDVPNVTIAGNRGIGNDGQISGEVIVNADDVTLAGLTVSPGGGTALTIRAQRPVFYNCGFVDASENCIQVRRSNTAATFTQCRFHNWSHYGVHHNYQGHDEDHRITMEYCEFSDLGRHGLSAGNAWYHIKDCHMHGTIGLDPDHFLELRAPNSYRTSQGPNECGAPSGNAILEHNRHEMRGSSGSKTRLAVVRGEPTDGVWVRNNISPGNDPATGGCWQNSTHGGWGTQIVLQNASSTDSLSNVHLENNEL